MLQYWRNLSHSPLCITCLHDCLVALAMPTEHPSNASHSVSPYLMNASWLSVSCSCLFTFIYYFPCSSLSFTFALFALFPFLCWFALCILSHHSLLFLVVFHTHFYSSCSFLRHFRVFLCVCSHSMYLPEFKCL